MSFLAPWFLVAGGAVAGAVVLLHFLARRRPRPMILPTARFVPDDPARWPSRAPRPTDVLLLALRVLAIGAIAAAFAQPVREPDRAVTARVVLADQSRAVANDALWRDSVRALVREGDVLIAFDTATRTIMNGARDSVASLSRTTAPGSLSAALIAAERAALRLKHRADSVELAIVSPLSAEAWDAATATLRERWAGRVRLVSVSLARSDTASRSVDVRASPSDPVRAAMARFPSESDANVRLLRTTPVASDSGWVRVGRRVLIDWRAAASDARPSAQAVAANDVVLVAPLMRRALTPGEGSVIARFADGAPAIVEREAGEGCIREVAFDFPAVGDVPLRESARGLATVLAAPCEGDAVQTAIDGARLDSLRGEGALIATGALARAPRERSPATAWLLILGALLLLTEVAARPRAAAR
ncbi:MAG: BatA domain-containing protein [Gemmatimonadaceae bacterium]